MINNRVQSYEKTSETQKENMLFFFFRMQRTRNLFVLLQHELFSFVQISDFYVHVRIHFLKKILKSGSNRHLSC